LPNRAGVALKGTRENNCKTMKNRISRGLGFTLVELMVVVSLIGSLAAIAIPNLLKARSRSAMTACINNLRLIDSAKQQWATETQQASAAVPQQSDLDPYLGRLGNATNVLCPAGGSGATFNTSYSLNSVTIRPSCNFVPAGQDPHVLPN
jgi:prepilin-type N-terminal cleavage/methylation domain-containing protein